MPTFHLSDAELAPAAEPPPVQHPRPSSSPTLLLEDDLPGDGSLTPLPDSDEDVTTVLIVNDNADVRTYTRLHLERHYRVVEAANGQAALEADRRTSSSAM